MTRSNRPFEPVVRERLLERFDRAWAYRVVLVTAPAGFGKTVAVRQYLDRREIDYVRCALRRDDGTLLGFLAALAASLERVAPNMVHAYSSFYANVEQSPTIAHGVATWIASMLKPYRGAIFIDDLHHTRDDPRVAEMLVELVDRTGPGVRWVFSARDANVLPVATWLAYGVTDIPIDETDLRLTASEASAAARASDVVLSDEALHELLTLTDSWATAFAFALRVSTRTSELARVAQGTREMIYGFLAEQVFRSLDAPDREFLLRTAPLATLDLDVLRASDLAAPSGTIERLRRSTAFVTEESKRTFRYHDLFHEFLDHELRKDQARYERACNDAAAWLERAGDTPTALAIYADARNDDAIVRILEAQGAELFDRGEVRRLESLIASLPGTRVERSPLILALRAMIVALKGDYERADADFLRARALDTDPDAKAHIAMRYAITLSWRWRPKEVLAVLDDIESKTIQSPKLRARFLGFKAYALSGVHDSNAEKFADRALEDVNCFKDVTVQVTVLQYVALVAMNERRLPEASAYASRALKLAEANKLFGLAGRLAMMLASIASEAGDDQSHLWHVRRMRHNAEQIGDTVAADWATMMAYGIYTQQGDVKHLLRLEPELANLTSGGAEIKRWPLLLSSIAMQHGWAGNFSEAFSAISGSGNYAGDLPDAVWRNALRWAEIALYAAAAGERGFAESAFANFSSLVSEMSRLDLLQFNPVMKARLIASLSAIVMGRSSTANALISAIERDNRSATAAIQSLTEVARALYVHVETDAHHERLSEALHKLGRTDLAGFVKLIEALPLRGAANPAFGALTPTELRVLISIAHGATSKEIASEMKRSALTVDSHVKAIVKKLGCRGRRAAVALARESGIV